LANMTTTIKPTITLKEAYASCGTPSKPSKMPGLGTSTPAIKCITGSKLRDVKGSVCEGCYAMKNMYVMPNVQDALLNRWELVQQSLTTSEPWIIGMVKIIWNQEYFRWHDSGDLQSRQHLLNIIEVARRTPHVKHWIPSREYAMVKDLGDVPPNLCIRMSGHMVDGPPPTGLGFPTSTVVTDGTHDCPAYAQDGACSGMNENTGQWEDCRKCWDTSNANTSYPKH
jgi:hypothetical protein